MYKTFVMHCIYSYDDFRTYLSDVLKGFKDKNRCLSMRAFAKKSGLSPAMLTLVISGRRNLSSSAAMRVAKNLKLNKEETSFFHNLVLFNQADTHDEKKFHFQEMSKNKRYRELKLLENGQFEYCSKWYYATIRELISLPEFKEDPEWIADRIQPRISPKEAKHGVRSKSWKV